VASIAVAVVAYFYFKHVERRRRLEIVHQERLVAMEKGIPLPELPLDPPRTPKPQDPRAMLIHGIAWLAMGAGGILALRLVDLPNATGLWPLPLPLVLLGVGLILFYFLASGRGR
jgi:hypothetical protein